MPAAAWTNQTQRTGPTRSANDQNPVAVNDLSAGKTITFFIERMPFAVAIQSLENLEFLRSGKIDRRQ